MRKYKYKHEIFNNFQNTTLTETFLNNLGEQGWRLKSMNMLGYDEKGHIKGICIFVKKVED